jgi:hypothetical protein
MKKATTETGAELKHVENLNNELNLLQVGRNILSADEMLDVAEGVDDTLFDDATSEYLKMEIGDKATLIFTGFGTMKNDEGRDVETAEFTGKENKRFVSAGTVIVSSLKKAHSLPCVVRLTHQGEVKGKNGKKYADIRVQILKDVKAPQA